MNYRNLLVGVDIGGTKISIVFFRNKKIVKRIKLQTNTIFGPKNAKKCCEDARFWVFEVARMRGCEARGEY